MVNTRNNNLILNTPPSTDPIQVVLAVIQIAQLRPDHEPNNTPYGKLISIKFPKFSGDDVNDWVYRCKQFFKVDGVPDERKIQPDHEPNNTPYGKLISIKFPKFSGDDVNDWVYRCKQFFKVDGVPDERKIQLASMHLFDAALVCGQLHSIEVIVEGDLDNYIDGDDETYEDCVGDMVGATDSSQITPNALSSLNSYQTMRVRGRVGKQIVHILVDYDGIHNFLDIHTAKKLRCRLDNTTLMQVSVANGQRMMSTFVCYDFKWSFQNEVFTSDVMLLPLGGCKMLLGIQWLATLGDIRCNLKKLIMKFNHKGRQLVLTGITNTHVHWMHGNEGMMKQAELSSMALCVYPVQLCQMKSVGSVSAKVDYLGYIISVQGVSTDPSKIEAMQKWPIPLTLKQLRGFLGLTSYYRRFIKDYASISQPLMALTKKDAFKWNPSAELAYHMLKEAMIKAPLENDLDTQNLIKLLENHSYKGNKYSWTGEILKRKDKVVVGNDPVLRKKLVQHFHDEAIGGHSGAHVTMKKLEVEEVDMTLQARKKAIKVLKFHLKRSQDRMRNQANKHMTDRQFKVGDWVYLKLQPHRQVSIRQGQQHKLSPKYYGPFKLAERIREVAYRLELPSSTQIHPVFHISQLKKCHGKDHSDCELRYVYETKFAKNGRRIEDLMLTWRGQGTKAHIFFFGLLRPVCLGRISQSGMPPNLSLISILRLIVSALWLQPRRAFQSVRKAMSYGSEKSQIMLGIRRANRQQTVCTLGSLLLLLMLLQLGATVYSVFSEIEVRSA
nr:retrovirus-related Pol polyprotein from transposon 17.6 [Tanacetum cinerariifolium]